MRSGDAAVAAGEFHACEHAGGRAWNVETSPRSRTDDSAARAIRSAFPGREVVPLEIDGLAAGGGGIHCATMQEPAT
jgi:N-dimethylarginine dimethylaminohydrolase